MLVSDCFNAGRFGPVRLERLLYSVTWKPSFSRNDEVGDDGEYCYNRHDHRSVVEVLSSNRELIGREQDSDDPAVPENRNELKWLAELSKTPPRLGESLRGEQEPGKTDKTVGRCGWDTCCADETSESGARGQNGAGDDRRHNPDHNDSVFRLSVRHLGDPTRERQNTVSGYGEDQS